VEVLRWAREHFSGWSKDTSKLAAGAGNLEVLWWAVEHGCPVDRWTGGHVHGPLREGTWRCCSGLGGTAARGTGTSVPHPPTLADANELSEVARWVRAQPAT